MPEKQFFTFHTIRERAEQGDGTAWRAFVEFYAPLLLRQLDLYFTGDVETSARLLEKLLGELTANDLARFRAMARQSEREFLSEIRGLLLDIAAKEAMALTAAADATAPVIDGDKVTKLLEDLPLMHQEVLFLKLSGYTDATIETMLRVAPRVAEKAVERLAADYPAAQKLTQDGCPWPADWLRVLHEARAAKKDDCKPLHEFMRIQDGQVSWYDKEPIEKHAAGCLHCLERWTALREVWHGRRVAAPLSEMQTQRFITVLPLAPSKKSLLWRVFGR